MREDDPENPYTLTRRQVIVLFVFILVNAVVVALWFLRSP